MTITAFTYIGIFASAYWLIFKFIPWLEGER